MEAWANFDLSTRDLDPIHPLGRPGNHPCDTLEGRIKLDFAPPPPHEKDKREEYRNNRKAVLEASFLDASCRDDAISIVSDTSVPDLPMQAVTCWRIWHNGNFMEDWQAVSLCTSDDTELHAIAGGTSALKEYNLDEIQEIQVYSDSTNMLNRSFDASHHSGQCESLMIIETLAPWLEGSPLWSLTLLYYIWS
jgi:hypothetical protein